MGKAGINVLGLGAIAVAAILIAKGMLKPTQEKVERNANVLSGAYEPRIVEFRVLEDSELPEGVEAPPVGAAEFCFVLAVLYPEHASLPEGAHRLVEVNGVIDDVLDPIHVEEATDEEGATVYLTFRSDGTFRFAHVARGDTVLVERAALE